MIILPETSVWIDCLRQRGPLLMEVLWAILEKS